jgi:predicted O-methyltransferase YrrM
MLRPGYARVVGAKVLGRVRGDARKAAEAVTWARPRSVPIARYCKTLDAELWAETEAFGLELRARAAELGRAHGVKLGGGARAELLFFMTRLRKPETILETGVLHGYSSAAFLEAMERNGNSGRLLSSDFPYFREKDPEALVGVLVPDEYRDRWTLLLDGDRRNLPALLADRPRIDLFHYDSDKSYRGRKWGTETVEPYLGADAWVLMDDIQDNLYFRDWVQSSGRDATVLGTGSYFVGGANIPLPPR